MINEYEAKAIEKLIFFAKNNGATIDVSRKSGLARFDFGDIVFQFQGNYRVDMLCYNKSKRAVMKLVNLELLSKDPLMARYKKPFFGVLGGGMFEIRCSEWFQLEEIVENLMILFVDELYDTFIDNDPYENTDNALYKNIGEHLIKHIKKSCK